jgi:hypothetical protein
LTLLRATDKAAIMARATAILLNDTTNWYHWGCTATSLGLKSIISERYDLIDTIPIQAARTLACPPNSPAEFHDRAFFERHLAANGDLYSRIERSDCVFVNGEGTIHGLKRVPINLLYMSFAARRHLNKPVYVVNHSVYPATSDAANNGAPIRFYRTIYAAFDYVAIRETLSKQIADGFVSCAVQSFDCLLLTAERLLPERPKKGTTLAIAGSAVFDPAALAALVAFANEMKRRGYEPVVVTGAQAEPAAEDSRFVTALRAHDARGWTYADCKSLEEWFWTIGTAALLVSGRFHHSLAAFAMRTPFVMLNSNTPKMNALATMLGAPEPIRYSDPNLGAALAARAEHALSEDFARAVFHSDRIRSLHELTRKNLPPS